DRYGAPGIADSLIFGHRNFGNAWKLHPERRTHANLALHMHLAAVLLHDAVAYGQAKPGALVLAIARLGLGGKERVEDAMQVLLLDPSAEVLDHHPDVSPRLLRRNPYVWVGRIVHGVARIQQQIQRHLLQL